MTQMTNNELPKRFKKPKPRPPFGFMKGIGEVTGDIVSPIEQPWEVLHLIKLPTR